MAQQARVLPQVLPQPIHPPKVEGHDRRVGEIVSLPDEDLEHLVFSGRIARIGFEGQRHRRQPVAVASEKGAFDSARN